MTKVTVEMVRGAEALFDEWMPEFAPVAELCRRVIEPGEEEIKRLAKLIADELGDNYDLAFNDRLSQKLCRAPDGSFRDVNAPERDSYDEAARAVLASLTQGEGE